MTVGRTVARFMHACRKDTVLRDEMNRFTRGAPLEATPDLSAEQLEELRALGYVR